MRQRACMKNLIIFGVGDYARVAHYYFSTDSAYSIAGFAVDATFMREESFLGLPVVASENLERHFSPDSYEIFVAIGYTKMNTLRAEKYGELRKRGYRLASYLSSRATYLSDEPPGEHCFLLESNVIQPFVRIGANVVLWSGNHIGHDVTIGDHCFVASHVVIAGFAKIGTSSFLGANAVIRDGITVADGSLIGAGSVIMENTEPWRVYAPERTRALPKLKSTGIL